MYSDEDYDTSDNPSNKNNQENDQNKNNGLKDKLKQIVGMKSRLSSVKDVNNNGHRNSNYDSVLKRNEARYNTIIKMQQG